MVEQSLFSSVASWFIKKYFPSNVLYSEFGKLLPLSMCFSQHTFMGIDGCITHTPYVTETLGWIVKHCFFSNGVIHVDSNQLKLKLVFYSPPVFTFFSLFNFLLLATSSDWTMFIQNLRGNKVSFFFFCGQVEVLNKVYCKIYSKDVIDSSLIKRRTWSITESEAGFWKSFYINIYHGHIRNHVDLPKK